ncbi:MAG TPA: hypothetical protein VFC09_10870, partial [Candidatus Dormibacteraeota bacterium]|nr:hypothetical protein [Candidatus Dormibacteraeota bacterium]
RESIDLRFTEKMVARERPDLLPEFIRAWLNPAIAGNEALERLVLQLNQLDEAGLFLPILCQELHFLSGRMLSSVEREKLRTEVQRFTEFLIRVAQRRVGEEIPLEYEGPHLRVVIQIVSKRVTREAKKGDIGPWLRFALKVVQTKRPDHIYFVGNAKEANKQLIEQVAKSFCLQTGWQWLCEREYNCKLHDADGQLVPVRNFMVVCEVAGRSPA